MPTKLSLSFFNMALATALGAVGAHGLKDKISLSLLQTFETGVRYHLIHALALIVIALYLSQLNDNHRTLCRAWWSLQIGIVFFSGNCYLYALTGLKFWALLVPIGGFLWILTWLYLALSTWKKNTLNILLFFALLPILSSCSHRYETYETLDKRNLLKQYTTATSVLPQTPPIHTPENSISSVRTPIKLHGRREMIKLDRCRNQWLFFSNALHDALMDFNDAVTYSCLKHSDFLLNAVVREEWWSLIFFSRACYKLEAYCSREGVVD